MLLSACLDGQGLSVAGSQMGLEDERSSLVKEIFRIWDELPMWLRPQFYLLAEICHPLYKYQLIRSSPSHC